MAADITSDDSEDDTSSDDSSTCSSLFKHPWIPFTEEELADAMNGRSVPEHITDPFFEGRLLFDEILTIMRGIRHSFDFATSPSVVHLCDGGDYPELKRTQNARLIMSDVIPDLEEGDGLVPYCIWYPDVPKAGILKELAARYPFLRYHVGRACAVAGYTELYRSLSLLPDVSIAEEARDNGSLDIFNDIVSRRTRYRVMDDYTRSVNTADPSFPAFINNDVAVRSSLKWGVDPSYTRTWDNRLNITEDYNVAEGLDGSDHLIPVPPDSPDVALLYTPLPPDLPAFIINKDVLILMAAYEGNVDRYARLRRPFFIRDELACVVRGIYYNTSFARWWSREAEVLTWREGPWGVESAVAARFIMNNDVDYALSLSPLLLPSMFWHPTVPSQLTLRTLAAELPVLAGRVLQACIAADYSDLYDELKAGVAPHLYLMEQAKRSGNLHYREDLERRAAEAGIDLRSAVGWDEGGAFVTDPDAFQDGSDLVPPWPHTCWVDRGRSGGVYNGNWVNAGSIELYLSIPEGRKWRICEAGVPLDSDGLRDLMRDEEVERRGKEERVDEERREVEGSSKGEGEKKE